jgi:hypothetical protein
VRRLIAAAACCGALVAATAGTGLSGASYSSSRSNPGETFVAAADWTAPAVSASVIAKSTGGTAGAVHASGSYFVYANVADTGSPASGTTSVTADLSALTTGATAVALTAGSFAVGGVSYGYRSAAQSVGSGVTAGTKAFTVATSDAAGNTATRTGLSVIVDNTAPAGSDVQTVDVGGTAGQPQTGDRLILSYTETIEASTILAGWNGSSTNVVVHMDGGTLSHNVLSVWNAGNSSQLPLGSVDMGSGAFALLGGTFGASGTPSTMSQSGSTITVTLGTPSFSLGLPAGTTTLKWTPASGPTDIAGNGIGTAQVTESGTLDKDF